jgi:hypothetical protein
VPPLLVVPPDAVVPPLLVVPPDPVVPPLPAPPEPGAPPEPFCAVYDPQAIVVSDTAATDARTMKRALFIGKSPVV